MTSQTFQRSHGLTHSESLFQQPALEVPILCRGPILAKNSFRILNMRIGKVSAWRMVLLWLAMSMFTLSTANGAQFSFGTLIRVGFTSGNGASWKIGAGASSSAPSSTNSINSFNNAEARNFSVSYDRATNSATVSVARGGNSGGPPGTVTYSVGGPAVTGVNAIWTLPASAFLLTALGPNLGSASGSSITVSNLALSVPAINILQPLQTTTLTASRGFAQGTVTAAEPQAVVFRGDANGNWQLTGTITMTGLGGANGVSGNELTFALTASANDAAATPEPGSFLMLLSGLAAVMLRGRIFHGQARG